MSFDPADFAAPLRAEQNAPGPEETLRRERATRRRKAILGAGAGILALGAFGVWLASATGRESLQFLTRFDRDEVEVLTTAGMAKTDGTMTYEVTPSGELSVQADYTLVYALVKTGGAKQINPHGLEVARVVVHRQLDTLVRDGKLHPQKHTTAIINDDCTAPADGFIHPLFYDDLKKTKKWASVDPYAEKHITAAAPGACVRPTRA